MAKNKQTNNLKKMMWSADDLFKNQEERDDEQRERIYDLNLKDIEPFPNHPFKVRNDDEMNQLAESIKDNGIIVPIIVRPIDGGKYQTVAGHRRSYASKLAGKKTIPAIVRNLTDDEATILMVDSNNQRETLLPSEKAFAYKMRLEAMKRQVGRPSKKNSTPLGPNLIGTRSNLELAAESPDSKTQIQRYIRLTYLAPELLSLVDEGRIKMRPAVEISYLHPESQKDLIECIEANECTPSHAQTLRMRKLQDENKLNFQTISDILSEAKPNQKEKVSFSRESLKRYFPENYSTKQIEDTILKALEFYRFHQKQRKERSNETVK